MTLERAMPRAALDTPPADEAYRRLLEGFERAVQAGPGSVVTTDRIFAGRTVRFRIAGSGLAATLLRPFAHLAGTPHASGPPALAIDVWDEQETGIACEDAVAHADVRLSAAIDHSPDGRRISHRKAQMWIALDRAAGHIVAWVHDTRRLTAYQRARPLHSELLLWHSDRRVTTMHAGLVATANGDAVLLAGPGGAGKSTTALTCLQAGFRFLGDDWIGIEALDGGRFIGHSILCSTALAPSDLAQFPAIADHTVPERLPGGKLLIHLAEVWPERMAISAPIRAIVLPRVQSVARPRLRPATKSDALVRIAPSSLPLLPDVRANEGFVHLGRLVNDVPTFWLDLASSRAEIPHLFTGLLSD